MLFRSPGDHSRLYRIGVMLLNGYGYSWYRLDNRMRADDLLIRSRASDYLTSATVRLRDLEGRYRRKYLPPPTRERPDPESQHVAMVRQFRAVDDRITEIDTRLRGGAVPPDDKVWLRHRNELDILQRLGQCDAILAASAKELDDYVAGLPQDAVIDSETEVQIKDHLDRLTKILTQRSETLGAS